MRKRVQHAFAEKAYEIADATAAVLSLSKEGATLMEEIRAQCSYMYFVFDFAWAIPALQ